MSEYATIDTLYYISSQVNRYGYILILVTGLFGNSINIIMFATKLKGSVCSRYLLVADVSSNICILVSMLPFTVVSIYGRDGTESSVVWCRIENFLIDACYLISTWTLCLASVDRYLCSSRQPSRRRWSSAKVANYSIIVTIIVSLCLAIPDLLYWYIDSDYHACFSSQAYRTYLIYFLFPCMLTLAPVFVLLVAGCKTYQNLRTAIHPAGVITQNARKERMDNQLARMLLVQIVIFLFQTITLLIYFVYQMITLYWRQNDMQAAIQYLAQSFIYLTNYSFMSTSFYVYYLQSSRYRSTVNQILTMRKRQEIGNSNQRPTDVTAAQGMVNTTVQAPPIIEL